MNDGALQNASEENEWTGFARNPWALKQRIESVQKLSVAGCWKERSSSVTGVKGSTCRAEAFTGRWEESDDRGDGAP